MWSKPVDRAWDLPVSGSPQTPLRKGGYGSPPPSSLGRPGNARGGLGGILCNKCVITPHLLGKIKEKDDDRILVKTENQAVLIAVNFTTRVTVDRLLSDIITACGFGKQSLDGKQAP